MPITANKIRHRIYEIEYLVNCDRSTMKRAAIGIRAHSGWGAVVVVSATPAAVDVVARRRIGITDPNIEGAKQPYHFARSQQLPWAETYLAECAAISEGLAAQALGDILEDVRRREYAVVTCAILLASGRSLPSLSVILASHSLIHAAEGEFFRRAFWKASERLGIPVTGIRERELDSRAEQAFGEHAISLRREIAALGRLLGPPWTTDQKTASFAAVLALASSRAGELRFEEEAPQRLPRDKVSPT